MDSGTVAETGRRPRVATVWMGGCSGCHMSLLDMDERLLDLASSMDVVYSPFVDAKDFPDAVDVTLVEGAVANADHLAEIRTIRSRTRVLVAFGDCAITGNVTALRNPLGGAAPVLTRAYLDLPGDRGAMPNAAPVVPPLLDRVLPVASVVDVDLFLPGCPPHPDLIHFVLAELVAGRMPDLQARHVKFG